MNPYPGLRPFSEADQDHFFGREEEIDELLGRLAARRFIAVLGTSGCGKSSLVRAGIIPVLRSGLADPSLGAWRIVTLKPGAEPLQALDRACGTSLAPRSHALRDWAREQKEEQRILLLVDQFEEVLAYRRATLDSDGGGAAALFVDMILTAARDRESWMYALITMRTDYLGECSIFRDLAETISNGCYLVPQLTRLKQQDVIERPAEECGAKFDPALVQQLLNNASEDPDKLPVLQHLLKRLWEAHKKPVLDLNVYEEVGGWKGALEKDAEGVLQRFADEVPEVSRLFQWITEPGPAGKPVRRPCVVAEIPDAIGIDPKHAWRIIKAFVERDFLRLEPHGVGERLDLMHESVMWQWPRLEAWIAEEAGEASRLRFYREATNRQFLINEASIEDAFALREKIQRWPQWAARYIPTQGEINSVLAWIEDNERRKRQETEALNALGQSRSLRERGRDLEALHLAVRAIRLMPRIRRPALLDSREIQPAATLLCEFGEQVNGVQWSRDELLVLTWGDDGVMLWDAQTGIASGTPLKPTGTVLGARFGPDFNSKRSSVLAWSEDCTATIWAVETGEQTGYWRHPNPIRGAEFSRDGKLILTWDDDQMAQIRLASGDNDLVCLRHEGAVLGAQFIRHGTHVLTWSSDGAARIWDARTGEIAGGPFQHQDSIRGACFYSSERFPDRDDRVLTWSVDRSVCLWDVQTGHRIGEPLMHKFPVLGAELSLSDSRLITWGGAPRVHLGGLRGLKVRERPQGSQGEASVWKVGAEISQEYVLSHGVEVTGVVVSKDQSRLVTFSGDGMARIWNARTRVLTTPPLIHAGAVKGGAFDADEARIITWSDDHTAQLWNAENGRKIGPAMQHDGAILDGHLSQDRQRLLTWSRKGVRIHDIRKQPASNVVFTHRNAIRGARISRDESRMLTWSHDKTACLWNCATGQPITGGMTHEGSVGGARFNPDETRILTWCGDRAFLWDADAGQSPRMSLRHEGAVFGARFSPDGKTVLSWSEDRSAKIWDTETGQALNPILSHEGPVTGGRFSQDGFRIVTWSSDCTARIWDLQSGQPERLVLAHDDYLSGARFDYSGRRVLTWSSDCTARIWDAHRGQPIFPHCLTHRGALRGARFSGDERLVITWSDDRTARIWDAITGKPAGPALEHQEAVRGIELSIDSSRILTWSDDHTARLWDTRSGEPFGVPFEHEKAVLGARFSKNEDIVLSWSEDGTARIWEVRTGLQLGPAIENGNEVSDARFFNMEGAVVTVSGDRAQISNLNVDLDFPVEQIHLWLQAVTGTEYDLAERKLKTLTKERWQEVRSRYLQVAAIHAQTCQYASANDRMRFVGR